MQCHTYHCLQADLAKALHRLSVELKLNHGPNGNCHPVSRPAIAATYEQANYAISANIHDQSITFFEASKARDAMLHSFSNVCRYKFANHLAKMVPAPIRWSRPCYV